MSSTLSGLFAVDIRGYPVQEVVESRALAGLDPGLSHGQVLQHADFRDHGAVGELPEADGAVRVGAVGTGIIQ